ncbi:hypothetical protein ABID22_004052 [Pontibacter aydingkolensis]|uniref:Lipoprotein n=1 Tax=Pontibacter aydingkolensis TaxID=1911536 RepID=A0ABS7D066_9BACT|nr:hypothetical protein [Pontibacter aydingkolensis]MBW7469291.1 hypothetical protein [Pontibacter aydingkolensis]
MKTFFTKSLLFAGVIGMLSSCASSYKAIVPENINYTAKTENNQVLLEYKYDVLAERKNKKYAKREKTKFVQIASVKITNNSSDVVTFNESVRYFAGANAFTPLEPTIAQKTLKQGVPIYLLYLLMTNGKMITGEEYTNGVRTKQESFPIGLILGPGLTAYNMIKAGTANQNFLKELNKYNLQNKQILPGETVYGLVAIPNSSYNPLYLQVNTGAPQAQQ